MEQPKTVSETANLELKQNVHAFWNAQSCDTQVAKAEPFSKQYFEEIETFRYFDQPFIHSFAQFTRFHGKRVLEVGFGAGTDFIQWLRAGAITTGIDLTEEALRNLSRRIQVYGLQSPEHIEVADAENLPFSDNSFDLGYSFGVLHHTPDTEKAIRELIRVVKPGGEIKLMLYNRYSIFVFNRWLKYGLLRGRPWKTLRWVLWNHTESTGTKGYTRHELQRLFNSLPIYGLRVETHVTSADFLSASALPPLNWVYRICLAFAGYHFPWRPWHYMDRANFQEFRPFNAGLGRKRETGFSGNPFGFYHCISGRKR